MPAIVEWSQLYLEGDIANISINRVILLVYDVVSGKMG